MESAAVLAAKLAGSGGGAGVEAALASYQKEHHPNVLAVGELSEAGMGGTDKRTSGTAMFAFEVRCQPQCCRLYLCVCV